MPGFLSCSGQVHYCLIAFSDFKGIISGDMELIWKLFERIVFVEDRERLSLLSEFLKRKVKEKGWSKKEFAEKAGLNETYVYKLLSAKRDFTPTEETLNKISDVLEFSVEDRDFILDVAGRERESGELIYPEESVPGPGPEPSEPGLPESSPGEPAPSEPEPLPTPEESAPLPEPEPGHEPSSPTEPGPPASEPSAPHPEPEPSEPEAQPQLPVPQEPGGNLSWFGKNKKIIIAGVVILVGMALIGCCLVSVFLWPFWGF